MLERVRARTDVVLRASPWFLILVLIAAVQVIRGQPFDAVLFGVGAVAIAVDALAGLPARATAPALPLTAVIVVAAALAVVLVLAPRHGVIEGIAVAVVGLVAVPLAWLRRPGEAPRPEDSAAVRRLRVRRAAVGWAFVVVLACLAELYSFLVGRVTPASQDPPPAISALLDPALEGWPGRILFVVGWLALGGLLLKLWRRPDA